jgi:hypothetical protein
MKKVVFVLGVFLLLGFQPLSFAQPPSINGDWLFDISGIDQGGAFITFADTTFTGYGFARDAEAFAITGENLVIDAKGKISGTYEVCLSDGTDPPVFSDCKPPGTITGNVDKKVTKISLKLSDGPNAKGIKAPVEAPDIPQLWIVKGKGQSGDRVTLNVTIKEYPSPENPGQNLPWVYSISGSGLLNDDPPSHSRLKEGSF